MSQSSNYRLSEAERDYLRCGETGSYSEAELKKRIQEKQCNIDSRIQLLIKDLTLMYQSELYNYGNNCSDIFEDLNLRTLENSLNISLIRGEPGEPMFDPEWGEQVTNPETPEEFGYLIGGFLHILFGMRPLHRYWERALRGLFHFYLMGAGKQLSSKIEDRRELYLRYKKLKNLVEIEQIENLSSDPHHIIYTNDKYTYVTEHNLTAVKDRMNVAQEVLDNVGMPSSGFLQYYLSSEYYLDKHAFSNSAKEMILQRLSELQEHDQFNRTMTMVKYIISDREFFEQEWRGPDRLDIIKEIYSMNSRSKSSTIAANLGKDSSSHLVTNALKRMSNNVDNSERWTCYPATEKYSDDWKLTSYGEVLAMHVNGDLPISEIERYAVPDKDCVNKKSKQVICEILKQMDEE